jgi:hypothetical protein
VSPRSQVSFRSVVPLAFAVLVLVVLAAADVVSWSVVIAVAAAVLLLVVVTYLRLGRRSRPEPS